MFLSSQRSITGITLAASLCAGSALADTGMPGSASSMDHGRLINANFGFTTQQTCVRSMPQAPGSVSIDPDTRQLLIDSEIIDMSGSGIMTFTKNGDFTLDGVAAEFQKSQLAAGQSPIRDGFLPKCKGNYTLGDNNKLSLKFQCAIDVPSQHVKIQAGPVLAEGYLAQDGQSATLNLLQNIQTLTVSLPQTTLEFQRMCLQRFSLEKVDRPAKEGDFFPPQF